MSPQVQDAAEVYSTPSGLMRSDPLDRKLVFPRNPRDGENRHTLRVKALR